MENIIIQRWIPLIYGPLHQNVPCFVIESMSIDIFLPLCTDLYASVYGSVCVFVCIMCVCTYVYLCDCTYVHCMGAFVCMCVYLCVLSPV